jgi:SpoVK/Ycf46/Vps4 family AAA+-type ATPase
VFSSLAAFMGDTRRRGKVIWFLMTSRPDLVPVDLKRQGRAEEHIALFPPQNAEERGAMFRALQQRMHLPLEDGVDPVALFGASSHAMSGADLEAILVRANRRIAAAGGQAVSAQLLKELIADFQPPAYPLELEYQRLIAAFECTSRALLPPDLAQLTPAAMGSRLAELRAALGR